MEIWLSVSVDGKTRSASFTEYRLRNVDGNCKQNLQLPRSGSAKARRAAEEFRASKGDFLLVDGGMRLQLNLKIHSFGGISSQAKTVLLERGTSSNTLLDFITRYESKYFERPSENDLALLNNPSRSQQTLAITPSTGPDPDFKEDNQSSSITVAPHKQIADFLLNGDFNSISLNADFKSFHNGFLGLYSEYCSHYLQNPVGRSIVQTEVTTNSFGIEYETQIGEPTVVYIEARYADRFDAYFNKSMSGGEALELLNGLIFGGMSSIRQFGEEMVANNLYLRELINRRCTHKDVEIIYQNLYQRANGLQPVFKNSAGSVVESETTAAAPVSINCWDTNGNGLNDSNEDRNRDGYFDLADCQDPSVAPGIICLDPTTGAPVPCSFP